MTISRTKAFVSGLTVLLAAAVCFSAGSRGTKRTPRIPAVVTSRTTPVPERPAASVLVDKGDYYRYQGTKIRLKMFTDRVSIIYRGSHHNAPPAFKNKARFRHARYHRFSTGKRRMEIMRMHSSLPEKTGPGAVHDIETVMAELEKDTSVAHAAPVYYDSSALKSVFFTDRIAVAFKDSTGEQLRQRVEALTGAVLDEEIMPAVYSYRCISTGPSGVLGCCRLLENIPGIEWAEPELVTEFSRCYTPDDPMFNRQWHLDNTGSNSAIPGADLNAADAWDIQRQSDPAIVIAVVDDGVDFAHPDLHTVTGGKDFCDDDDDPSPADPNDNHGTAVAGVAAAISDNSLGGAGVAPGASILPVKISKGDTFIPSLKIAEALTWAYENGADILNNSWGGGLPSNAISTAIRNASTLGRNGKGCPVFFSSGNLASAFTAYDITFNAGNFAVAFVYQKNASISSGDDCVIIDNIVFLGSDRYTVLATETFSGGGLPSGWSTSGGGNGSINPDPAVPGWWYTTSNFQSGFGDAGAMQSGTISDDQWTELRMPMRTFENGEVVRLHAALSTQQSGDSLLVRYYNSYGRLVHEAALGSGIDRTVSIMTFPATADSAIAVGASTDQDFRSDYSQYNVAGTGKTVDFLAPSGGGWNTVYTTDRTGTDGYTGDDYHSRFSGTSSACPAAAGVAALILSRNPHLSRDKVLEVLRSTSSKIGDVTYVNGWHKEYGYGRLNARAALIDLPPVIIGQNPIGVNRNQSVTITVDDLDIVDTETPDGPFIITLQDGENYTVSSTTIIPTTNFTGTLLVPASVSDGIYTSDHYTLTITVRATNNIPMILTQQPVTIPEDGRYHLTTDDLTIRDPDDPGGPFSLSIAAGSNYTVVNDTVLPTADFNGTLTIPVIVHDGFGSSSVFDFLITVSPVNDAPAFAPGSDIRVNEDITVFSRVWATSIASGPTNENTQQNTFTVSITDATLFAIPPALSTDGTLTFVPAPDVSGSSAVTVRLYDNGGTVDGGIDSSIQATFTITVLSVNDPPFFTEGAPVTVNEDGGAQSFSGWATGISTGPENENDQTSLFAVTTDAPSLFAQQPALTSGGTLLFTAADNRYGEAHMTVQLFDNGGTGNGGCDSSGAVTVTITVAAVNDAPSFTAGSDVTVNEDAPAQHIAWAASVLSGPEESDQRTMFTVHTSPTTLFSAQPVLHPSGVLSFTPAVNASGVATITAQLFDEGGTVNGGIDSSARVVFTITVVPVNDAPTFTAGTELTVPEDAPQQIFPQWAAISCGAPDETNQKVTISLTVSNPSLFSEPPSLSQDGTLSFTPAANQFGSTMLMPHLTDNGGTANGGSDQTTGVPFLITVTPVNDAPSFTAGSDIVVDEDTGTCVIYDWATGITPGPLETDQAIVFSVFTDYPSLFSTPPEIDTYGTLFFTPAPDANGTASIAVFLRDNGGTVDSGIDSSASAVSSITVTAVNDSPRISINGSLHCPLGKQSTISVTVTDPDNTIPEVSVTGLPDFAIYEPPSGTGIATITCSPQADTGAFSFSITASDGEIQVDSMVTLVVFVSSSGAIELVGAPPTARVALHSSAGWIGREVLTGSGRIDNVPAGTYLLSVSSRSARTEYYPTTVLPLTIDTVTVSLRQGVAIDFPVPDTFTSSAGIINAGELVSAVIDDADNDGYNDLLYAAPDGTIYLCKRSGESYTSPEPLHSSGGGTTALRCLDWNEDGINDLLSVNTSGTVSIALGTGGLQFRPDSTLFSTFVGCTSVELVPHNATSTKGYYFGFINGSVVYDYHDERDVRTTMMVYDHTGTPLNAGENASVAAFDVTGDGQSELLIGNGTGYVEIYSLLTIDTVRSIGTLSAGGRPLVGKDGISLSTTFGSTGKLPSIVYSDGNGTLLRAEGKLRGDINDDGIVDILDLQQLGFHWGQRETDTGWSYEPNLQVPAATTDPQIINVLDLQILGNCWKARK